MATHINDWASAVAVHAAVHPSPRINAFSSNAIDLISSDGDCFAIQQVGSFEEGNSWTGRIEQSADGSSWSDIPGAVFAAVTAANNTQVLRFRRTARYVRYSATVEGSTNELILAVLIGQQRKSF
ncbi:MAG: hypothetical protein RMJ56_18395 [Gemmataceae bacterium]|nr:discoidin domain-containing protein [Gemmata sp.]MDW8199568.1 hypothetical protein [Gemmataceae bacterium]